MTSASGRRIAPHLARRRGDRRRGVHRIAALSRLLDDPQDRYRCLHVTGTNGKTTVTRLASAVLTAHGLRVGSFTSPHLHDVRERIAIDGAPVSEGSFLAALDQVEPCLAAAERELGEAITFFELMTAVASVVFAEAGVDVAVVEAGIGGRRDATNLHHGEVSVITSVAVDHPELGRTTPEVAREKAGIIEPGSAVVTGPMGAAATAVIAARASCLGARTLRYGEHLDVASLRDADDGQDVVVRVGETHHAVTIPLRGPHQSVNASLALGAAETILEGSGRLDVARTRTALAGTKVAGRAERIERVDRANVLLDVAHNGAAARALAATLVDRREPVPLALVLAAGRGRDVMDVARPLLPLAQVAYVVDPDRRATSPAWYAPGTRGTRPRRVAAVGEALLRAECAVGPGGEVLVTGTHGLVAAARQLLHGRVPVPDPAPAGTPS